MFKRHLGVEYIGIAEEPALLLFTPLDTTLPVSKGGLQAMDFWLMSTVAAEPTARWWRVSARA